MGGVWGFAPPCLQPMGNASAMDFGRRSYMGQEALASGRMGAHARVTLSHTDGTTCVDLSVAMVSSHVKSGHLDPCEQANNV